MKKLMTAFALATLAASAGAQVTFSLGTDQLISGVFDPSGTVLTTPPLPTGGKRDALISTTAGVLTVTFLGFEALDTDTLFRMGFGTLTNKTATPDVSSLSGIVPATTFDFTFTDTFTGATVGNGGLGGGAGMFDSYVVLGTGTGAAFVPYTKGGLYDLVIGFNDALEVDGDYDDLVIGLRVTAVPEPESYALMLAGLARVGFIARRRQGARRRPELAKLHCREEGRLRQPGPFRVRGGREARQSETWTAQGAAWQDGTKFAPRRFGSDRLTDLRTPRSRGYYGEIDRIVSNPTATLPHYPNNRGALK